MDVQGIDQVMIIPTDIDTYPWLLDALGAKAFCRPTTNGPTSTPRPIRTGCSSPRCCRCRTRNSPSRRSTASPRRAAASRWSVRSMRWATIRCSRNTSRCGTRWKRPGMVYGMHPFPAGGALKPPGYSEQYSGAELIRRTMSPPGVPHSFLTNVQNFQAEAALWVTIGADVGLLRAASEDQRRRCSRPRRPG